MKNFYGLYRAKCLNNLDPLGQSRILVHVYIRDGDLNYNDSTHQWIPVLSPYGGLRQMGLFMTPPIHAEGFVEFEEGDPNRPVWIGAYPFAPAKEIDEESTKSAGYSIVKVNPTVPQEMQQDASRIILKTQYPLVSNDDVENEENKIENLIILDETKLQLLHVNQNEYEFKAGGVSTGQASSYITLQDSSIVLGVLGPDGRRHEITINSEGFSMKTAAGDQIVMTDGSIQIIGTDTSQIKIYAVDNGAIAIKAKNVVMDGEQVVLGPPGSLGAGGAINSQCICPFTGLPTHIGSSKVIVGG
jgi:hypothetical protein